MSTGIIVFAHGSRIESANQAVREVAAALRPPAGPYELVETAFLELGQPDMGTAAARLAASGVDRIVIIPYFLTVGLHVDRDLTSLAAEVAERWRSIEVTVTPPLDGHPALAQILLDRARSVVG